MTDESRGDQNAQIQLDYMCEEIAVALDLPVQTPAETVQSVRDLMKVADESRAPRHLSEIFRIVEGATRGDMDKVRNYAGLLADKLEAEGDINTAFGLRKILDGKAGPFLPAWLDGPAGAVKCHHSPGCPNWATHGPQGLPARVCGEHVRARPEMYAEYEEKREAG